MPIPCVLVESLTRYHQPKGLWARMSPSSKSSIISGELGGARPPLPAGLAAGIPPLPPPPSALELVPPRPPTPPSSSWCGSKARSTPSSHAHSRQAPNDRAETAKDPRPGAEQPHADMTREAIEAGRGRGGLLQAKRAASDSQCESEVWPRPWLERDETCGLQGAEGQRSGGAVGVCWQRRATEAKLDSPRRGHPHAQGRA